MQYHRKHSKYYSQKVMVDGIAFDSKREAERYRELKLLQRAGKIKDLQMQVPFELLPAQYAYTGEFYKKGPKKGQPKPGKCIEKSVVYLADFVYFEHGTKIVEDVKGMHTKDYIIKRKLLRYKYRDIVFREVY